MRQKYTNVQGLIETIRERKSQGETNREIATSLDLTLKQVQQLITRENRRERLLAQGCVLRPKGRPRKSLENEEAQRNRELAKLRMQVELLRNFLLEVGRRRGSNIVSLSVSAVSILLKPCAKFLKFRAVDTMPGAGRRRKCPGING